MNLDLHPHFRAAFDVDPQTSDLLWGQVVRRVRDWIAEREAIAATHRTFWKHWFLFGGKWANPARKSVVITDREIGEGVDGFPDHWAFRWEHPDSGTKWRWWRVDLGLTRRDNDRLRVSVLVSHWMSATYVGLDPELPAPSSPALVRTILADDRWVCRSGDFVLTEKPQTLEVGEGHLLVKALESPDRACPIVFVSRRYPEGDLPLDTERLARNLSGIAVVMQAASSAFDKETEQLLPQAAKCWGGRVRIYYPGSPIQNERRNRFFDRNFIGELGAEAVETIITRAIVRWELSNAGAVLTTLDDVAARRRTARFEQLASELRNSEADTELLQFAETEIREARDAAAQAQREVSDLTRQLLEQQEITDQTKVALEATSRAVRMAERKAADAEAKARAVELFATLPGSFGDVVERIGEIFPDRIILTEEARKGAANATSYRASDIPALWEWVWAVATDLYSLYFSGERVDIKTAFEAKTGFEFAYTEGRQTKADKAYLRLREAHVNGKSYQTLAHVKFGSDLRIYFASDDEMGKLIIGHCGEHLDTAGTRRRK